MKMPYREDDKLIEDIRKIRNMKYETIKGYKSTIRIYTRLHKKSFTSMLREAEREEKKQTLWRERKVRQRLIDFRTHLIEQDYMLRTIRQHMTRIKTVYYTFEIELRQLPQISEKNIKKPTPFYYSDLPDKQLIRTILPMCKPLYRAIVLFMLSSGCARKETLNLKIKDFISATSEYHNSDNISDVLMELVGRDDIVPTWNVYRFKTGRFYTTFCSPEATMSIVGYLLERKDNFNEDSVLFKVNERYFSEFFSTVNEKLQLGKVGTYNRFRSHVLRKFHASALYNDGMSMDAVNELQGKSKGRTDSAYFVVNPIGLKKEYVKHMGCVCVFSDGVNPGVWGKLDVSDFEDYSRWHDGVGEWVVK